MGEAGNVEVENERTSCFDKFINSCDDGYTRGFWLISVLPSLIAFLFIFRRGSDRAGFFAISILLIIIGACYAIFFLLYQLGLVCKQDDAEYEEPSQAVANGQTTV